MEKNGFMVKMFGCRIISNKKVPLNESYVIMANHVSFLDVFAIPSVFTGKFTAVAASKNFNIPVYATFLKKLKVISIDRSNRAQSIKGIQQAEKLIQSGQSDMRSFDQDLDRLVRAERISEQEALKQTLNPDSMQMLLRGFGARTK